VLLVFVGVGGVYAKMVKKVPMLLLGDIFHMGLVNYILHKQRGG
jgi:hypothetical protein